MSLTIVGLGPGRAEDITRRAWSALENAPRVILRTKEHPCVPELPNRENTISCDDIYESTGDFALIYAAIVERVLTALKQSPVVYAVPGDPLVGEAAVQTLIERCASAGIPCEIVMGISFVEPMLKAVGLDALDGVQIFDALTISMMHHPPINPDLPALLAQVYSRQAASELKLTLMNQYPDEMDVALIHAAGTPDERLEWLKLYEIDRSPHIQHLTSLYVPPLGSQTSFETLQDNIAHLRAPDGCPWDRKQTHLSLRKYLLEETYEVLETLDREDSPALQEEMGDLLLQIMLHTQIGVDDGEFRMSDVIRTLNEKLIRRHPHVWGDVAVNGADQVVTNWDAIKQQEKAGKPEKPVSLLDGVPRELPALMRAYEYTSRAAKVGFDWENVQDVIAKLHEEIDEVQTAATEADRAGEIGDVLFVVVNWARQLKIDPETALRESSERFYRRFHFIEEKLAEQGKPFSDSNLLEMDELWNQAKVHGL
ncbi:MAG: MazG family protein [Chloroflexi bacterium OLB15]|nr:MAG: MazG family protein [Chloroflexi bacterium OLB15]